MAFSRASGRDEHFDYGMGFRIFQVDAFTDRPFSGNPAAVCVVTAHRDDGWMRDVAREMNLPETAFLRARPDGFELRWFTPTVEVDLCGHATLASAHVLWEEGIVDRREKIRFFTLCGALSAELRDEYIELDFPREQDERTDAPAGLRDAIGAPLLYVGRNRFDYIVEVDSEETLRGLRPDLALLSRIPARGVIATAVSSSPGYDFVSRFFAPRLGVDEDPVTGSAHCCLGPFWQRRLNKNSFIAYQASARGGVVRVRMEGGRVFLGGQAVTVLRGELAQGCP